ncbi:hypothetical protein [Hanstruepera marina]|uniref:hypothetical protein n=1 Tax=Hanstruepera marina TaxID=2873265 RepID=UPI001CA644E8|nr:hypothetical protein [Hanstruepera marina]
MTKSVLFMIIMFFGMLLSCKTSKYNSIEIVKLDDYISSLFNKGYINSNPLIVKNGLPVTSYSLIKDSDSIPKMFKQNSLTYIKKDYGFFENIWGDEALNGVVLINDMLHMRCYGPKEVIYLLNKEKVDSEKYLDAIKKYKMTYLNEFTFPMDQNNYAHISIAEITELRIKELKE